MRKIDKPATKSTDVYDACVAEVSNAALQKTYETNRSFVMEAITAFNAATATMSWASLPRVPRGNPSVIVAGGLTKEQLIDLYKTYMVGASGPSRKIYDDILVAAGGLCPFCGGLGHVYTLDHYLPKSNFPLYSVLPENLVPCCRDCNTGKNASFGSEVHEQTLHPYLDDDKYFKERWIKADISRTDPILVRFSCVPPSGWHNIDKLRVEEHFNSYKIAVRFSVQAGAELAKVLDLRNNSLRILSPSTFKAYLLDCANSKDFDLNGWNRTMYASLAQTEWFLSADFADPNWHIF